MPKPIAKVEPNWHQLANERHVIRLRDDTVHLIVAERGSRKTMGCGRVEVITDRAGFNTWTYKALQYVKCPGCLRAMR